MPDYDLTRLGSRAFEQMVVALGRKRLGEGLQVFGDGPDGGREATFEGTIRWSAAAPDGAHLSDAWVGYTVLQAKFRIRPAPRPMENAVWLQDQIRKEITGWATAAKEHTRKRLPDYLIFVTNVDLSPIAKTGGIDTLNDFVRKRLAPDSDAVKAGLRVKDFTIWHADQIRSMLDGDQDVRWAFPALLSVGDVLALLGTDLLPIGSLDLQDPLRDELLRSLKADRWIRLSQAGGPSDAKLWLDDIAIDLPAALDDAANSEVQAARHVLQLGEQVLRQRQPDKVVRPHVVIVGGPGQGKSTLSQMIAQAYRTALLADTDLGPDAAAILKGTREALSRAELDLPGNRRWPVRVDLAKYADELNVGTGTTLLRWISSQVSERTEREIAPTVLRDWLAAWPWALILDGLDEVPSVQSRRLLYGQIDDFLMTVEDLDADLLVVVTTRPTGYDVRFASDRFQHLQLQRLSAEASAAFSRRITDLRFVDDEEMRKKVSGRMLEASREPVTARLMETPLQVTIMSFIVEKFPQLAPDRFTLFGRYYETVFERESNKDIPIARFLSEHRLRIHSLHEEVGLRLQVEAEGAEGAEAVLDAATLAEVVVAQLRDRGFQPEEASSHASQLVNAATDRLVLLAPKDGGFGFEIRTLQELMAARALSDGDDAEVLLRLRRIAHSPHWRNTWLLAAGRLLLESDRFEKPILDLLRTLDSEPRRLNDRFPSAPLLAGDVLEDNLATNHPKFERALVQHVLAGTERPPAVALERTAQALLRIADSGYPTAVFDRLRKAARAGAERRAAAALLLRVMDRMTRDTGRRRTIDLALDGLALSELEDKAVADWIRVSESRSRQAGQADDLVPYIESLLQPFDLDDYEVQLLREGMRGLEGSQFRIKGDDPGTALPVHLEAEDPSSLLQALENEDVAALLELALESLPPSHWAIEAMLGAAIKPLQDREPVGDELLSSVIASRAESAQF